MADGKDLRVTLVQSDPVWEDKHANRVYYDTLLKKAGETDLIVLPEMFLTGFTMNVEGMAEPVTGPTAEWLLLKAGEANAVITGSAIIQDREKFYNRLLWAEPGGELHWYDKRHLFGMGDEDRFFTPGKDRTMIRWQGWCIRPLICYDLRFPVWSRNTGDYDLLLFVANWPAARHHVWKNLLVSRALENQCWCVAVNRTGTDGRDLVYDGGSAVIDPRGYATWLGNDETVVTFCLSMRQLVEFRKKFPVLRDRDHFEIV